MQNIKCVIIGDGGVGKTSMLMSYITKEFPKTYVPTVFDNYSLKILFENDEYLLGLFDTAGQDTYDRLRPLSYIQADVFLVCFSIVNPISLENVKEKWILEIKHHCPYVPFILVGMQQDSRHDPVILEKMEKVHFTPVTYHQGEKLAKELGAVKYIECSSITQIGMKDVFNEAIITAIKRKPVLEKIPHRKCSIL